MITESQIRSAIRRVGAGEHKSLDLRDGGPRGSGRLALIVRAAGERVISEWYAVYFRDGKRKMAKLGSYPTMPLANARKKFREEYAPAISVGAEPAVPAARRTGSVYGGRRCRSTRRCQGPGGSAAGTNKNGNQRRSMLARTSCCRF
jgi:hypothetical protein